VGDHLLNELAIRPNSLCISHDFQDLVVEIALLETSSAASEMETAPQALTERMMTSLMKAELAAPKIVDRSTFQVELDALRVREKAHTRG
jgi:hypothetical protein